MFECTGTSRSIFHGSISTFVIPDCDSTEVPTIARASFTYKNSNLAPADSESRDRQSMSARPRGRIPMGNSSREFESFGWMDECENRNRFGQQQTHNRAQRTTTTSSSSAGSTYRLLHLPPPRSTRRHGEREGYDRNGAYALPTPACAASASVRAAEEMLDPLLLRCRI